MNSSSKHIDHRPSIAVIGLKGLPAFGGAATVGQSLITELHKKYRFTVFSVKSHAQKDFTLGDVKQVILPGCPWKKLNVLTHYIHAMLLVLFSRREKFDMVHLHHTDAAFIAPVLRLRYKVVITSHGRPQDGGKWSALVNLFFKINERIAVYSASIFTSVSKSLNEFYRQRYNISVRYIPNGINTQIKEQVVPMHHESPYILFSAGRIIPIKGLHLLIDALKQIDYRGKLKVAGNIDQLPDYKKRILNQSKGVNIEFLGLIKDRATLLSYVESATFFVMPSLYEAMSIMLLEAGLMKTPMIVSDIEANTNVFDNEEVLFFKNENVDHLAERLKLAMTDTEGMQHRAELAYRKLLKEYQWKNIAVQYEEIYNSLIANNNRHT